MKYLIISALMLVGFTLSSQSKPQEVSQKAKNKAEYRVDRKIDNAIDKGLDKIEGLFKKKNKKKASSTNTSSRNSSSNERTDSTPSTTKSSPSNPMMGMMGGNPEIEAMLPDVYTFDHRVDMVMEGTDEKGKSDYDLDYTFFVSEKENYFGMEMDIEEENSESTMVFDQNHLFTFVRTPEMNVLTAMSMDSMSADIEEDEEQGVESYGLKKTGRTKTILGYLCEEFVMEDEEFKASYWVSRDKALEKVSLQYMSKMMAQQNKTATIEGFDAFTSGMMLEADMKSKKDKSSYFLRVEKIHFDHKYDFSTEGYSVFSLGN